MKEKELRLALVCYGGISLAVYLHGVTRETLKLIRASRAYHATPDLAARRHASYRDLSSDAESDERETDTEEIYFDILQSVGRRLDLRVIIDVIAGASAGGINGIFLARALAHDLSMAALRDMWLREADVTVLLHSRHKAGALSKWFLRPLIWALLRFSYRRLAPDPEIRSKLSTFLRSRWFRPPFDGERLTRTLYTGLAAMGEARGRAASLLPFGQRLELFVTLTDFFGAVRQIPLHDPPLVSEREHRHTLHFSYRRGAGGGVRSDFDDDGIPALTFAARATSSFPGAFPPAQLAEVDRLLAAEGREWTRRRDFIARNFPHYAGGDPDKASFVDGSVLNNKPFFAAIEAFRQLPAYRQVDRRLVYIDPDPTMPPAPPDGKVPGFFRTLKDTLSDIPRNEPVYDDLSLVSALNQKARRVRTVIEAARPRVVELVRSVMGSADGAGASAERIGRWRDAANAAAAREAGFAYEGYVRLKLTLVLESVARMVCNACNHAESSAEAMRVAGTLDRWARGSGIYPEEFAVPRRSLWRRRPETPVWVEFLQSFDADFRLRRLRFIIRTLNLLYPRLSEPRFAGVTAEKLDHLKAKLYGVFETIRPVNEAEHLATALATDLQAWFAAGNNAQALAAAGDSPGGEGESRLDDLLGRLAVDLALGAADAELDRILADMAGDDSLGAVREEVILHYVGFAFWDVLTFPIVNRRDRGEFEEIRVDRISPEDARTIREGGAAAMLKGIHFNHFAAFFSRSHRENDYLWGRLNAAERLIDILADCAAGEDAADELDIPALKKRAFLAILDAEAPHLERSADLIAGLRAEVEAL